MADMSINASLSGINAYQTMLNNTANNIANINTEGYIARQTVLQDSAIGGVSARTVAGNVEDRVDLSKEAVNLITEETGIKANIKALKTANATQKSVIDILA